MSAGRRGRRGGGAGPAAAARVCCRDGEVAAYLESAPGGGCAPRDAGSRTVRAGAAAPDPRAGHGLGLLAGSARAWLRGSAVTGPARRVRLLLLFPQGDASSGGRASRSAWAPGGCSC